jgi:hypothetical protein
MAMLDRLVDGAIVIKIQGPSYRATLRENDRIAVFAANPPTRNQIYGPVLSAEMDPFLTSGGAMDCRCRLTCQTRTTSELVPTYFPVPAPE